MAILVTSHGLSSQAMDVSQQAGQRPESCSVHELVCLSSSNLGLEFQRFLELPVCSACWYPEEVGSNATKGMPNATKGMP